MKKVKIITKDGKENKTTIMGNVKFVTFEKNFVLIQCAKKAYYYKNANVLELEVENNGWEISDNSWYR